jgi:hypothetical protein
MARTCVMVALLAGVPLCVPAHARAQEDAVEVRVERVKPVREKLPTLRFLKENRDFIRARFDLLREKSVESNADAGPVDPRYLAYRRLMAEAMAAGDSTASIAARNERMRLLASIRELGTLEDQLDGLEQLLGSQQTRLAEIQEDFTGRQRTELIVLVRGAPAAGVDHVVLVTDIGAAQNVPLSEAQRAALADGGVMQIFHASVEPREQLIEVRLGGAGWAGSPTGYIMLRPDRDRLTLLEIDLTGATPADGAGATRARAWLHDAAVPTVDG